MKRSIYSFTIALGMAPLLLHRPAFAQPSAAFNRLTPTQIQRFSRDLIPSSSQDFFEQGRRNFERETQRLTQQRFPNGNLLKISQNQKIQPDFSQFERPDLLPRKTDQ